jgi:hypothetical protein
MMRITVEQTLPCDLGTLHKFIDKATALVYADMTSLVTYINYDKNSGYLSICAARELE